MFFDQEHEDEMDAKRQAFARAEEAHQLKMKGLMAEIKERFDDLIQLSEESGLPFNLENMSWYLEDYKRWTTVFVPSTFREKYSGLDWEGNYSEDGYYDNTPNSSDRSHYWMPSSLC